jgi:hypothetical protein
MVVFFSVPSSLTPKAQHDVIGNCLSCGKIICAFEVQCFFLMNRLFARSLVSLNDIRTNKHRISRGITQQGSLPCLFCGAELKGVSAGATGDAALQEVVGLLCFALVVKCSRVRLCFW